MHTVADCIEYDPVAHWPEDPESPALAQKLPAMQVRQLVALTPGCIIPTEHDTHAVDDAAEYWPVVHTPDTAERPADAQ